MGVDNDDNEVGGAALSAVILRGRARPLLDDRTEDEILGYRNATIELADDRILYADDSIVAVDKRSGELSDATRDPGRDHLGAALGRWAAGRGEPDTFLPAHRLDRGTSGVVLYARNRQAATSLMHQFQDRTVTKHYQAIVHLAPGHGFAAGDRFERRSHLRHHKGRTDEVRSGGKRAETAFEVLAVEGDFGLIGAEPKTGRTHQLRVHLTALGMPIAGDDLYGVPGESGAAASRLWLHSDRLVVAHPDTGQPLDLRSRSILGLPPGGVGSWCHAR